MSASTQTTFDPRVLPDHLRALLPRPYNVDARIIPPAALARLAEKRARAVVQSEFSCTAVVRGEHGMEGFACWTLLHWDSEQFGFPAARLDLLIAEGDEDESRRTKSILASQILNQCDEAGIRHVTARVDTGDFATIHALERAGFELIDGIQTFSLDLESAPAMAPATGVAVRPFRLGDFERVCDIARSAYIFDRFHADSALSRETADRVNETWVANSCRGRGADAVLVAVDDGSVCGYITCRIDREAREATGVAIGSIVMVAAAPGLQGRGIGKAVTHAALDWFRSEGVRLVQVGTQLRNIPAGRLYESCGFRLAAVNLTFRKVL